MCVFISAVPFVVTVGNIFQVCCQGPNLCTERCKKRPLQNSNYNKYILLSCFKNIYLFCLVLLVFHLMYMYEGVSKSFRNHPKVKESEMSFLYLIHKTSLTSHFAKLHIPPTFCSLSTDQNCYMGA